MKKFILCFIMLLIITGCDSNNSNDDTISYMKAKEMIINNGALMLDVRTEDEYNDGHIGGALLFSLDDINEESALDIIDSKDSYIILYCQSGNRSHQALEKLSELGYTNVYDLGSIDNWKE